MNHAFYRYSIECMQQALQVLEFLRQRETATEAVAMRIRLRRRTADIALSAYFEELQNAFITPIDREELFRLRQLADWLLSAAEDLILVLRHNRLAALPTDDADLLSGVYEEYRLLNEVFAAIPAYPHSTVVLRHLTAAEKQHRQTEELVGSLAWHERLHALSTRCHVATDTVRYLLLKSV